MACIIIIIIIIITCTISVIVCDIITIENFRNIAYSKFDLQIEGQGHKAQRHIIGLKIKCPTICCKMADQCQIGLGYLNSFGGATSYRSSTAGI